MYIYLAQNKQFYRSSLKTEGVKNALIRVDASFTEDCSGVEIHNIKRKANTNLNDVIKTLEHVIIYGRINSRLGVKKIICSTPKIADSILKDSGHFCKQGCLLFVWERKSYV